MKAYISKLTSADKKVNHIALHANLQIKNNTAYFQINDKNLYNYKNDSYPYKPKFINKNLMRVNDFKYHKSKDSKEFDVHTGELLYYVDEPDTIYSTQNEKEFIEQVLNEIDERREHKRMLIIELEQRKRRQIEKDIEKKEQQGMEIAAKEQRKQEYVDTLRHEIIAFKDDVTTNINIKEITWFIKNCLGYHMEQFHIVFDYHYIDGDDSETKTVDTNITYLDVECLRFYLHN
jgi:hypothetical protein